jgi:hypothetical protein
MHSPRGSRRPGCEEPPHRLCRRQHPGGFRHRPSSRVSSLRLRGSRLRARAPEGLENLALHRQQPRLDRGGPAKSPEERREAMNELLLDLIGDTSRDHTLFGWKPEVRLRAGDLSIMNWTAECCCGKPLDRHLHLLLGCLQRVSDESDNSVREFNLRLPSLCTYCRYISYSVQDLLSPRNLLTTIRLPPPAA